MVQIKNQYSERILELIKTSTIHGLPNAVRNKNRLMKITWLFAFFSFSGYSFYSVGKIITEYLNFDVWVKIQIDQDFDIDFPSVTFCNLNPIDFSLKSNMDKAYFYISKLTGKNQSFIFDYTMNESLQDNQICSNDFYNRFLKYRSDKFEGFSLKNMLVSCSYHNKPCSLDDFTFLKSTLFGNCYSFNYKSNSEKQKLKVKQPGFLDGLRLELFTGLPELQPCWNSVYGAVIFIHEKDLNPLFRQENIKIQTGVETNIILNKIEISKKNKPYGNCIENLYSKDSYNSISYKNLMQNYSTYKQNRCLYNCAVDKLLVENKNNCDKMNITDKILYDTCINDNSNVSNYYQECSEECPVECKYFFYSKYLTHADYLTDSYAAYLLSNRTFLSRFPNKSADYDKIKKSLVSVNIYFESNYLQKINEQPKMEFSDLLGNLGGQLGLFLGISFLSFIEILEILFEIILITINEKKTIQY